MGEIFPYQSNYECLNDHLEYFNLILAKTLLQKNQDNNTQNLHLSHEQIWKIIDSLDKPNECNDSQVDLGIKKAIRIIKKRTEKTIKQKLEFNFLKLYTLFKLDTDEIVLILMLIAEVVHPEYQTIYAYLQNDLTKKVPCIDFALDLIASTSEERLKKYIYVSSQSRLLQNRLIKVEDNKLFIDEKIKLWLLDIENIDRDIKNLIDIKEIKKDTFTPAVTIRITNDIEANQKSIFLLYGSEEAEKLRCISNLVKLKKDNIIVVSLEEIAAHSDVELLLDKIFREVLLQNSILFFIHCDVVTLGANPGKNLVIRCLRKKIKEFEQFVFFSSQKVWSLQEYWDEFAWKLYKISAPSLEERKKIWSGLLPSTSPQEILTISQKYKLSYPQIVECSKNLHAKNSIDDLCQRILPKKESSYIHEMQLRYKWKDIALPKSKKMRLKEICRCIQNRHIVFSQWNKSSLQGINILFDGSPGTGKTMTASIIARSVNMRLYKINMIVGKYRGESEENLKRIFDDSIDSQSILFFDQADTIFGKRYQVRDAKDHYTNFITNYFLQKIENHNGIVILATNFKDNIDDALMRRIHFAVNFSFPCRKQRLEIWKKIFPIEILMDKIDYDFLAEKVDLSGGYIKNIAWLACFYAAEENKKLSMVHIIKSVQREYEKIGKNFILSDFELFI